MSAAFAIDPMPSRERQFEHPALFYSGLDDYLAGTLPFIHEGLGADEPVAVAVPGSRLEPLRAELGSAADQVRFLDMNEAGRNPGRILPGVLLAFADEHPDAARVRIIGEPIWPGRSATEYPACVQHEALINLAFAGRPATILCPYDAEGLPPEVLADAEATHPIVLDVGAPRASTSYAVDRVLAECNRPLPELTEHRPLRVDESTLSLARQFAAAEAGRARLGEDRVADVEMVVNELVTNSVEHGGGTGILRIWTEDAHLVVEVRDSGQLHDPLLGRRPLRPLQARGRGLFLVNHFADLVRLHTGPDGTTMRAYFGLPTMGTVPCARRATRRRGATRVVRHDGCVPRSPILDVPIAEDPIRLGQFLKLAGLAEHGGHAKALLEAEEVLVNGRVETRRGAQLRAGDVVAIGDRRARPVPLV